MVLVVIKQPTDKPWEMAAEVVGMTPDGVRVTLLEPIETYTLGDGKPTEVELKLCVPTVR
jgi:hypothetical protein